MNNYNTVAFRQGEYKSFNTVSLWTALVNTNLLLIAFISWARLSHIYGVYGAGLSQGT